MDKLKVYGNHNEFENAVRCEKGSTPHNVRPRMVPINLVWSCRNSDNNDFNLII